MPLKDGGFKGVFKNTNPEAASKFNVSRLSISEE